MLPERAAQWVADVIGSGSRITSARRLHPGGWHANHAVAVADRHGRTHRLVLRRWARPGWEADDPDYTVARETRVLELLHPTPVPAPVVVAADPAGDQPGRRRAAALAVPCGLHLARSTLGHVAAVRGLR